MARVTSEILLREIKKLGARIEKIEKFELKFEQIDSRFEQIDSRFKQIDSRFEKLETKVDVRFDFLKEQIQDLRSEMKSEFAVVHKNTDSIRSFVGNIHERLVVIERQHDLPPAPQHQS